MGTVGHALTVAVHLRMMHHPGFLIARKYAFTMKALLFKTAISVILIVAVLHFYNIEGTARRILDADLWLLGLAIGISIATSFIHACRWIIVMRAVSGAMNYARAVRVVLIGYFFNHFLPTSLGGDVYRIWHTHRRGATLAAAANAVILDRIVALLALLLMMLASVPWLFKLIEISTLQWALVLTITGGLCSVAVLVWAASLPAVLRRVKPVALLIGLSAHARALFLRPRHCIPAISLSVLMHAIFALVVFITARAIHLNVGMVDCLLLVPPVILITMLPFSIAGWGLREGATIAAFGLVNIASSDAFALSVLTGIVVMAASLPGALLWLLPEPSIEESSASINEI